MALVPFFVRTTLKGDCLMDFKNKIALAPMAGVTDRAFRKIAGSFGADFLVTEMISAKAVHYGDRKTATLADISSDVAPVAIQIFGHEPDIMAECVKKITQGELCKDGLVPFSIDINMGCPVKKIVTSGDGSALMKSPLLCGEIISACVSATTLPITVKIRAGWDEKSINCTEIAKIAEESGASAICVHGRTRAQLYEPFASWDYIKAVKETVKIPVFGNGDIFTATDAVKMLEQTGCDSVMVARGAMGNPFIFEEIKALINKKSYTPPTILDRINVSLEHLSLLGDTKGEAVAVCEARKHLSWYLKGAHDVSSVRQEINKASSLSELSSILNKYKERILTYDLL